MMVKSAVALCLLAVVLVIGACTPTAPAATLVPVAKPSATSATPPTPVPTPTPVARPTLPPTWTPDVTETVLPSATPDTRFAELRLNPPPPDVCAKFGPDAARNPKLVPPNTPVQIYWNPAKNAQYYEVTVYDVNNTAIAVLRARDTSIMLRAALFPDFSQPYAWLVIPFDINNKPLCFPRGGEFRTSSR